MNGFLETLGHAWYGNEIWRWGLAVLVVVIVFAALHSVKKLVVGRLSAIAERTQTRIDDALLVPIASVHGLFLAAVALYAGASVLALPAELDHYLDLAVLLAGLFQAGITAQRTVQALIERWQRRHEDPGTATVAVGLRFFARVVIWSGVVLLAMSNLGIEVSALVAGLGVGGVAAALAVQNVLGDLFASLGVYFDRPFDMGDFIIVGDDMGTVEKTGLRSTRVRGLGGQQIIFPNADLMRSRIHNYRRMSSRRVRLELGLTYDTTADEIERAVRIVRGAIEGQERVEHERTHFRGFGDSSLELEAVYWVESKEYEDFMDAQQGINLAILRELSSAGLTIAFPTRAIRIERVPDNVSRLFTNPDVRNDDSGPMRVSEAGAS